jgi:hypothetical protein
LLLGENHAEVICGSNNLTQPGAPIIWSCLIVCRCEWMARGRLSTCR